MACLPAKNHEPVLIKCHYENPSQADPWPEESYPDDPESTDVVQPAPLDINDDRWDIFLPDDDQCDPLPEPGDFWIEFDINQQGVLAA